LTFYLDTSLLVAALAKERRTIEVQAWLDEQEAADFAISDWVTTEFSAAISRKLRMGQIEVAQQAESLAMFARLTAESFTILPITSRHFHLAARLADRHPSGLRAGDALHLAICADHGATLCTLDRGLSEAGAARGVMTQLL
jgi:hypothetical protein